jgi:phosphoribosylanthranilate isomerase
MFLKVCCIASVAEALTALRTGARAIGLVSAMPSGPGVIPDALIPEIALAVPPPAESWLLTSRRRAEEIAAQHARGGTTTIQLVDALDAPDEYVELGERLPGVRLVQVIHVVDDRAIDEAQAVAGHVARILLDSGNPRLSIKELGGTGRTHNWSISRKIAEAVSRPVILAGGLNAGNVTAALHEVGPAGVDVCSGVRTNGQLDGAKLSAFASAAGVIV